jgi:signal transduction histidine kinase
LPARAAVRYPHRVGLPDRESPAGANGSDAAPALEPTRALLRIAAALDLEGTLHAITEEARTIIGAHQSVTSMTLDATWAQGINAVSLSDKYAAWRSYDERPDGSGVYRVVCRTNHPMRLTQAELEAHPAWRGFGNSVARHPPMRGWLAAPLIARDGTNLGLIQLSDKYGSAEFTAADEAVLVELAQLASVAIERARAEDALRASLEELRRHEEKLRQLASEQVMLREAERKRLGFDLHDNVCQELVGIGILIESARQRLSPRVAGVDADLAKAVRYVNEVAEHLRLLARELQPMPLRDLGLDEGLRSLAASVASPETRVVSCIPTPVPPLDEEVAVAVYRVAQEALANARRHAAARLIELRLAADGDTLRLEVVDDGRGFDPGGRYEGIGLVGMEERALAIGGRLAVSSASGRGTTVALDCPLAPRRPSRARA